MRKNFSSSPTFWIVIGIVVMVFYLKYSGGLSSIGPADIFDTTGTQSILESGCYWTSTDDGHNHKWCVGDEYTTEFCEGYNDCHSHEIDEETMLALEADNHTHILRR